LATISDSVQSTIELKGGEKVVGKSRSRVQMGINLTGGGNGQVSPLRKYPSGWRKVCTNCRHLQFRIEWECVLRGEERVRSNRKRSNIGGGGRKNLTCPCAVGRRINGNLELEVSGLLG